MLKIKDIALKNREEEREEKGSRREGKDPFGDKVCLLYLVVTKLMGSRDA